MSSEPEKSRAMDEAEPTAEWSPAPIFLIALFALLVYWGMIYLDNHGGGFSAKVYAPYESLAKLEDSQPVSTGPEATIREGHKVFQAYCEVCHQANGLGGPNGCPPLVASEWVVGGGPNRIIRLVLNGGTGPITVKGQQYNVGGTVMTPQRETLNDKQIAAVLSYVRNEWGNKGDVVKEEQVKKVRAETATRQTNWTPEELQGIPDKD